MPRLARRRRRIGQDPVGGKGNAKVIANRRGLGAAPDGWLGARSQSDFLARKCGLPSSVRRFAQQSCKLAIEPANRARNRNDR
jgi:hypothetical protein